MSLQKLHRLFFILTLVFLPTQLGLRFWPSWSMVLGRRVDYLSPTIYLTDILILLTIVFWLLSSASKFSIFNFPFGKTQGKQFLIFKMIAVAIFIGINIFFASNQFVAIYKWIKILEFGLFGYYIIKTKPTFLLVAYCLSLGIFYSSLIAISQFLLQHSIGGTLWWLGERTFDIDTAGVARTPGLLLRPYATFPHPNVLGGYLAALMPLVILQYSNNSIIQLTNKIKAKNFFLLATILLGLIALVITFSRSAILVGFIGSGIALLGIKKINKFLKPAFLIGSLILFFFISKPFNLGEESVVVRQELNAAAIKIWSQSPIIGVGLGNFLVKLPETIPTRTIYFLQPVHNIYLLILSETGIIGLVFFMFLIWKSLIVFKLSIPNYQLSIIVLLILGLVDHYPLTLQQGQLLLTLLLALEICPNKMSN